MSRQVLGTLLPCSIRQTSDGFTQQAVQIPSRTMVPFVLHKEQTHLSPPDR